MSTVFSQLGCSPQVCTMIAPMLVKTRSKPGSVGKKQMLELDEASDNSVCLR